MAEPPSGSQARPPLRIGMLTTGYPHGQDPIAGIFVRGMARALAARGHTLEVLAAAPPYAPQAVRDQGIEVDWVRYIWPEEMARTFYGAGAPDNMRTTPWAWPGLLSYPLVLGAATLKRVIHWDAIISHWALPSALIAGLFTGSGRRRPHLSILHSADVHLLGKLPQRRRLALFIAHGATELSFSAEVHRQAFLSYLPPEQRERVNKRMRVRAMGIEDLQSPHSREEIRREMRLRRFTLLFLGRLVPIKGLSVLLEALRDHKEMELLVAGDGPERARLTRQAQHLGVRIRWLGTVGPREKARLLRAADLLVVPSLVEASGRQEGLPTVCLEAAAAGLAIVGTRSGGMATCFAQGESAHLCEPGDANALSKALGALAKDPKQRKSIAAEALKIGEAHLWPQHIRSFEAALYR